MQTFATLKANSDGLWQQYIQHEFVRQLAAGTLPQASFAHYLQQDYLYLQHFTRAWALALYKSDNLAQMRHAQAGINTLLDTELGLHIEYCRGFGLDAAALDNCAESSTCVAYTRYILDTGMRGDLADLYTALMPCFIGYAEVGNWIMTQDFTVLDHNPYHEWIKMYSGAEFQQAANAAHAYLNNILAPVSAAKFAKLQHIFNTATRMEIAFWQMGLDIRC